MMCWWWYVDGLEC